MNKILIVDDDRNICEILEFNLKSEGFDVTCCLSAEEALEKVNEDLDLILLDVMMGGMSGYKMAETLRNDQNLTPIIFLTAKDTENDMLTGFSVGGDDYISKPFSIKEVVARVKAVLKRTNTNLLPSDETNNALIAVKDLIINPKLKEATIKGESLLLTKTEFELLFLLASNGNRIFSRQNIINNVWKATPYITERTVDVHITRLRKKLGDYACLITNRSGYGYRFDNNILEK
ncbi:MAG: response regulator transcription factor [Bacteroidales bacterium]|jgi:two-component system alkaline phosphatase synthesis response regulator PhoP|nr:response regulator transcription factor [Bacteroidales bacterium]